MAFTYIDFVANLAGMTVSGVKKSLTYPPAIDASVQYPLMFPRLPSVNREAITLASASGLKTATAELVVVVERDALNLNETKFSTAIALIDALDSALITEQAARKEIDAWTIRPEVTDYGWSLIAIVEGSG